MNDGINRGHIEWDKDEIKKLPDKECCLVCSIIVSLNVAFIGTMMYLINNEGLDGSIS